jgi:hypothetical protein
MLRVDYKGTDEFSNYRLAEISFTEDEMEKVEYIAKVMKVKGWNIDIVTDGYAQCEVEDKDDYRSFMEDWKEVKKNVALWKKFNIAY